MTSKIKKILEHDTATCSCTDCGEQRNRDYRRARRVKTVYIRDGKRISRAEAYAPRLCKQWGL